MGYRYNVKKEIEETKFYRLHAPFWHQGLTAMLFFLLMLAGLFLSMGWIILILLSEAKCSKIYQGLAVMFTHIPVALWLTWVEWRNGEEI